MTETSASNAPAPMEGHGAYNRNSRVQAAGLAAAIPLFKQAAAAVSLASPPEPILIADYGASEGHNSLVPMGEAIGALRQRVGPSRAILVAHTDLPSNDFSALFETLENDPDSYLRGDEASFASAVGKSFYEQLLPTGSVTLGWSSWSVQWLSRTPGIIPDQVQIAYSRDAGACANYARQAAEDWQAFLVHRGEELRLGGQLVVLTMAKTDDGDFGYRLVLDALLGALMDLVSEGVISDDEVRRMAIPTVGRTRADLMQPFAQKGRFAGLSIECAEVFLGEDRIWEDFKHSGDANTFGARWAAFVRASTFPTLALSLKGGGADPRVSEFFQEMESRLAVRLALSPEPTEIPLAKVLLVKTDY
jgi:SAM dependent carboxyl methyltransferase